ncbi:DUF1731 domain-containing protein [Streptomyces sp. NPDC058470]|uniref:DUF1731 domain-containing protein n=1 Tax=Streptomyces sp. NPDC058470 TaxID=3346515 RepID=UPI0036481F33
MNIVIPGGTGQVGTILNRASDTELLLKSHRAVPGRILEAGFLFDHHQWPEATAGLVRRARGIGRNGDANAVETEKPRQHPAEPGSGGLGNGTAVGAVPL